MVGWHTDLPFLAQAVINFIVFFVLMHLALDSLFHGPGVTRKPFGLDKVPTTGTLLDKAFNVFGWTVIKHYKLSLAISALVKWKPLARLVFLGSVLVMSGMGESYNQIYGTWKGSFLDLNALRDAAWAQLFGVSGTGMPGWSAWLGLAAVCGLSVWVLSKRLEAYEVVK